MLAAAQPQAAGINTRFALRSAAGWVETRVSPSGDGGDDNVAMPSPSGVCLLMQITAGCDGLLLLQPPVGPGPLGWQRKRLVPASRGSPPPPPGFLLPGSSPAAARPAEGPAQPLPEQGPCSRPRCQKARSDVSSLQPQPKDAPRRSSSHERRSSHGSKYKAKFPPLAAETHF